MRTVAVYIAIVLTLAGHADSARILGLFPHTGKSHQMVFDPLLRRLAERGHHLTVASFFPLKNPPANYTSISLEGLADPGVEVLDLMLYENPPHIAKIPFVNRIARQIDEFSPLSEMALRVCSRLVNFDPLRETLQQEYDLVLVEQFNSDCMLGLAHIYGIKGPFVALLSSKFMPWSSDRIGLPDNTAYLPVISSSFTDRMTFLERLENTIIKLFFKWWYRSQIQTKEQEMLEKKFGRKITDLRELGKNVSLMFTNTFYSLNGVRLGLPGVVEVGGMHLDDSKKTIPRYIERFLNESDHGVVLFSLGSLIKTASMPKYKVDIIMNALSRLKQRVIWKYEDSEEEGTLIGNVLRVRWLPQYELLKHDKVVAFIAHGGLLGMTEAVAAGKPVLVMPFFADQHGNGAEARQVGIGEVVTYERMTENSFYEDIQNVLRPEKRIRARRVSKIWKDRLAAPLDTAVFWIERVIRWPEDQLYCVAKDLSVIQFYLIDVAGVLILVLLVLILLLKMMVTLMLRFIGASSNKKEKIH